jgi:hypothetical protein
MRLGGDDPRVRWVHWVVFWVGFNSSGFHSGFERTTAAILRFACMLVSHMYVTHLVLNGLHARKIPA